jgi:RNA recognition motif-containing protein
VAKKLFVGNLPYTTTNEELGEFFAQYGEVLSAAVIMDRATGRSKGFGFVEMTNDEEADAAIAQGDAAEFEGRKLTVSEARPKTENRPQAEDRPPVEDPR